MATIYTDSQGRQVYDYNGKTIDAKTGQPIDTTALPPIPPTGTSTTPASSSVPPPPASTGTPTNPATPPLQATGTFNLPGYQTGTPASQPSPAVNLPAINAPSSSSLVDFANALDQATNFAKQKRNASFVGDVMAPSSGTLKASDFSSILSGLNSASDKTSTNLINRAITTATPSFQVQQFGNDVYQVQYDANGQAKGANLLYASPKNSQYTYQTVTQSNGDIVSIQYDPQGQPIGQQKIYTAPPKVTEVSAGATLVGADGKPIYTAPTATQTNATTKDANGNPVTTLPGIGGGAPTTVTKEDIPLIEKALLSGEYGGKKIGNPVGSDGYIDPSVYVALMNYWIQQGGTKQSFLDKFSYKKYINPANTWVWDQLGIANPYVKKTTTSSSSSGTSGSTLNSQIDKLNL